MRFQIGTDFGLRDKNAAPLLLGDKFKYFGTIDAYWGGSWEAEVYWDEESFQLCYLKYGSVYPLAPINNSENERKTSIEEDFIPYITKINE